MAELKTLDLRPGGQTAHVWEGGDANAPTLLFLHPITGIPRWGAALESLAESFHVIAPYQPGWGPAKDDLPGVRDALDLVLFNVDLLNTMGVGSAHVVGVSIGGWIGAEIAAIRPDAVQSLTLVNPLGLWSEQYPGEDAFAQHPGFPTAVLFSNPDKRTELLMADRDPMDAYVGELLDLRASAKFRFDDRNFNSVVDGDYILERPFFHAGFAVEVPDGLLVAVVRHAHTLTLEELAHEVRRLVSGAKAGSLGPEEVQGQTFTVSNIGAVGGGTGTPIIPYGTSAILSVGRAEPTPVVVEDRIEIVRQFPLSLSYDHRLIDGALGRRFLDAVVEALES